MKNIDLNLLIPHRTPALIVSSLESSQSDSLVVKGRVDHDHPLVSQGSAPAVLLIEFAAQGAGVLLSNLRSTEEPGAEPPEKGYLTSLREVRFLVSAFEVDQTLTAEVKVEARLGGLASFSTAVKVGETLAATGRFSLSA